MDDSKVSPSSADYRRAQAISPYIDGVPRYTIGDVSDITGISIHTLRYYDKCGFFPNLARNGKRGDRSFSEVDLAQLRLVDALRRSGLSIEGLQYFVRLQKSSSDTTAELMKVITGQKAVLDIQAEEIIASLRVLEETSQILTQTHSFAGNGN